MPTPLTTKAVQPKSPSGTLLDDLIDAPQPWTAISSASPASPADASIPGLSPGLGIVAAAIGHARSAPTTVAAPAAAPTTTAPAATPPTVAPKTVAAVATPSWMTSLATASIKTDIQAADVGGVITESGLATLFTDLDATLVSSKSTLTAAEMSDLKTVVANLNNGVATSSYLSYVTNALVNGNAANATWMGGGTTAVALGNLATGASATQLSELEGKWLLGTDLPSSKVSMSGTATFSVSYSAATNAAFSASGPSMDDINQGYLGDCFLLASLAEVAKQDPAAITSMITANGNNTYGVRFFVNGQAQYVTVNNALANGGSEFNSATYDWASLVEKAYAQLQTSGSVTGNTYSGNSWGAIGNGGCPEYALEEITGATVITDFNANGSSWSTSVYNQSINQTSSSSGLSTASVLNTLTADLAKGYDVVLSSYTNATSGGLTTLVSGHAMSVYGYDSATGMLQIRNPWGTMSGQNWATTFEVGLSTLLAAGDTITVDNLSSGPAAPSLVSQTANQVWTAGQKVSFTLPSGTFIDPQGQALTYKATQSGGAALPTWLTFNASTLTFSGTVPTGMAAFGITVTATDTSGLSASETFTAASPAAPVLASQTAAQTWVDGKAATLSIASAFSDPQGATLTYAAAQSNGAALPTWLSFNASTGTFSGTPPASATALTVKVTATDTYGLSSSETFTVATPAPVAPTVTQTAAQTWAQGAVVSLTLPANTFVDPQGEALTYKATLSNGDALPTWLAFNTTTEAFSGTVAAGTNGLSIVVTATDAGGASSSETITVATPATKTPTVTAQTAAQTWVQNTAVSFALPANTFTDPQGLALTYSATQSNGAALPSWLAFNTSTHTFSGTVAAGAAGFSVTVTAKDTAGLSASETFAVATPAPVAPKVTAQTAAQTWTLGQAVSLTLPANTFTDPQGLALTYTAYQLQYQGDQVASWLHFNAVTDTLSGTVPTTESGNLTLEVIAKDSAGLTATDIFNVSFKNSQGLKVGAVAAIGGASPVGQTLGLLAQAA